MSLQKKIEKLRAIIKKMKVTVDKLYTDWDHGKLKATISEIDVLKRSAKAGGWQVDQTARAASVEKEIMKVRDNTITELVDMKQHEEDEYHPRKKFFARDVKVMKLEFPETGTDEEELDWCRYAKRAAFAMEKFHSHVYRKNPKPREAPDAASAERDKRAERTAPEQDWLKAQDKMGRFQKKLRYLEKVWEKIKDLPESERRPRKRMPKKHEKEGDEAAMPRRVVVRHKKPRQAPPEPQVMPAPERQMSRRAPAIAQYERPRVSSRLPAFPAFPAYPRR